MDGFHVVGSLGAMIVVATVLVLVLKRLYVPSIVSFIVAGLLIPPLVDLMSSYFPGSWPTPEPMAAHSVDVIAEVGIALLLFIVGLELSLEKIRDVGRVAVLAGLGQVAFTAVGGFIIALLLQFDIIEAVFLATALTFSSTVVVVKLLDQKKALNSLYGRIAVGIFLVQDLVVVLALTFLSGLGNPEELEWAGVTVGLVQAFLGMAGLLGLSLVASRYLLPGPFNWASRIPDMLFIWSLGWCFLFVILAEAMGLSPELGAFLAGISLAQLDCSHDLRRRIHPLMNFFIAVFFISLGAGMELEAARDLWFSSIVLSLFVLIGNPFIFMWIIVRSGYSERTSFLTSVTVAQISEFSFIFAALGVSSGLIGEHILSLTAMVGLVTIGLSAYMIVYNEALYEWVRRWRMLRMFRAKQEDEVEPVSSLKGHVVVLGMNTMGRMLAKELHQRGIEFLAIDRDAVKLRNIPGATLQGNIEYFSVVEEASLDSSKLGVSTLRIEDANNLFVFQCNQAGVPVVVHGFDTSILENLRKMQVEYVIDSKRSGVNEILAELARLEGRGA